MFKNVDKFSDLFKNLYFAVIEDNRLVDSRNLCAHL